MKPQNEKYIKYQTFRVTIPNGSSASVRDFRVPLDRDFTNATEYSVIERSAGGNAANYNIGLTNQDGIVLQDLTPKEDYLNQTNVPRADRYKPLGTALVANGREVKVTVETFAAATADIDLYFIFKLENL